MTRRAEALAQLATVGFVRALLATRARYTDGMMARSTYRDHVRTLRAQARAAGVLVYVDAVLLHAH